MYNTCSCSAWHPVMARREWIRTRGNYAKKCSINYYYYYYYYYYLLLYFCTSNRNAFMNVNFKMTSRNLRSVWQPLRCGRVKVATFRFVNILWIILRGGLLCQNTCEMRFEVLTEVNTTMWLLGKWRHIPEVVIIISFRHVPEHFSYNDKCSAANILSTSIRLALSGEEDNSRSWEKTRFGKSRVVGYFAGPFTVGRNKFSAYLYCCTVHFGDT